MRVSASTFLSMTRIDWPAARSASQAAPDFVADQRRQAFGRLVEDEQPRIGHQRAADRQHLLLAAGQQVRHAAGARWRAAETARRSSSSVHGSRRAAAVSRGGDQIFARGEIGKHLPAFRHQADAELGDAVGRQSRGFPRRRSGSSRAPPRVSPMIERTVVVLPMPLRPISDTISPGAMANEMPNSTRLKP